VSIHLRGLDPAVRQRAELALSWAEAYGIPVTVTSGYRSWAEQTKLRQQFESCISRGEVISSSNSNPACRYPANEPGDSSHNYRWAWDSWVPAEWIPAWVWLRRYAGFTVPDHDMIHAEVPEWRSYLPAPLKRG